MSETDTGSSTNTEDAEEVGGPEPKKEEPKSSSSTVDWEDSESLADQLMSEKKSKAGTTQEQSEEDLNKEIESLAAKDKKGEKTDRFRKAFGNTVKFKFVTDQHEA